MTDTIELLEAIGRDASLRHASTEDLAGILLELHASEALTAAVASGDSSLLAGEFGHDANYQPQAIQTPGHEEDETDEEDDTTDVASTPDGENANLDILTK
jgi:hypothetical protein